MPPRPPSILVAMTFVLIWSTGFIVARLIVPVAEPLTFLAIRFSLAALLMALVALATGARWPGTPSAWRNAAISGALMQAGYLGGIFWAISHGLPAALSALIAGGQPIVTAILAGPLVGERVSARRWTGIGIGSIGIALVIAPRLGGTAGIPIVALLASIGSTLSITAGTAWQKRTAGGLGIAPDAAIQFAVSAPLVFLLSTVSETGRITLSPAFWFGLAWAVFGLSIGAIGLLLWMLRRSGLVRVASLVFLVPPATALMSYGLFGDTLTIVQLSGMVLAAVGVALSAR